MTDQEIFDKVAAHLFAQGERSYLHADEACAYRSDEGLKCAVGCLIPDADYDPNMEFSSVDVIASKFDRLSWMADHTEILIRLQTDHDRSYNWISSEQMRHELRMTALTMDPPLDPSILDTLSFKDR